MPRSLIPLCGCDLNPGGTAGPGKRICGAVQDSFALLPKQGGLLT